MADTFSAQERRVNEMADREVHLARHSSDDRDYHRHMGRALMARELAPLIGELERAFNEMYTKVKTTGSWL